MHVKSLYSFRSSTNVCVVPLIRLDRSREMCILFHDFVGNLLPPSIHQTDIPMPLLAFVCFCFLPKHPHLAALVVDTQFHVR
jgi:hypothetical protein